MDNVKRKDLELKLKNVLKEHQRDGLNMIGNVDRLLAKLVDAVEQWSEQELLVKTRSA